MARPKAKDGSLRVQVSITLPKDLADWLDNIVEEREVATRSFAIEKALLDYRKSRKF